MTRFNIELDEAVKFVLDSVQSMKGGEIFVQTKILQHIRFSESHKS